MGWRAMDCEDLRLGFVLEHLRGDGPFSELCERFGISRKTGYKWVGRHAVEGVAGLADRSRAPHAHGRATEPEIVAALVDLKQAHPSWGPRKLVARLAALEPAVRWPSHSTASLLLGRAGLVQARRARRRAVATLALTEPDAPNRVWAADHKGWFALGDRSRCEPVTITDLASRYLLALEATGTTRQAEARPVFERAFAAYGLPAVLRTDNGAPFASAGPTGLTRLSAWWIRLGIRPERIMPGKPQQNGRHERFHATLGEAVRPASASRAAQQARFEAFRRVYNDERPHEALGQIPPAARYVASGRPLPARDPPPDYPADALVRRVRSNGEIKWGGHLVYVSQAIIGEWVAVLETPAGLLVRYHDAVIGRIDPTTATLQPHTTRKPVSPIYPG
jgi:putative transposase